MADEPTAWEDINPRMVSVPQPGQQGQSLGRLQPATSEQFGNELTACLALVVPVGMTEEGRREWLAVAWATLKHLPPDILAIGCKKARETCDHPSKIVPAIIDETKELMRWRRETERDCFDEPLQLPKPNFCTASQAAEILAEYGLKRKPDQAA